MLTVRDLIARIQPAGQMQTIMLQGLTRMIPEDTMSQPIDFRVDEQARTVTVKHGGQVVFQAGFDEVNSYGE